jgi:DNA-binding NtrC family response regulator/tetratricopeptide (TPR) repeat protein
MEAKRGFVAIAARHTKLGQALLSHSPNLWLDSVAENNLAAIAIMLSDVELGMKHARRAIDLARESGAAAMHRAALANLGNLYLMQGRFEESRALLRESLEMLASSGEYSNGSLDSLARTYLAEQRLDSAMQHIEAIELTVREESDWALYANRYALLTKVEILIAQGAWSEARRTADGVVDIARQVSDRILEAAVLAKLAEISRHDPGDTPVSALIGQLAAMASQSRLPAVIAHYERTLGHALLDDGQCRSGAAHLERANLALEALGCMPLPSLTPSESLTVGGTDRGATACTHGIIVQNTAAVLMHAGRPELVAAGLIAILKGLACVTGATAISVGPDGGADVLDAFGTLEPAPATRTFDLGTARGRTVELRIALQGDLESAATINSIGFIISAVQELERGRLDREERLTLWPVDEMPADDDDSVVTGKMRELMIFARKVAQTSVSVLVTGESGTGKEVLARAIHRYSPRARKPFIPFNCTAVPRELVESQLFGYKRGAFTGAERDSPGLIRAAKDGTLFLDEIGELGLDLQPKLLRFLESGEIHPLGETSPMNVNVRIVAATNANLEQLVAEGRFREDLYYRLNVVPLVLPPLRERRDEIQALAHNLAAKAATEFGKGRSVVGDDLMAHLLVYPWPGNVRQLNNELRRMVAIADADSTLTPDHLPRTMRTETEQLLRRASGLEIAIPLDRGLDQTVAHIEREMIQAALRDHHGRVEAAAKALGISRKGLYLKRRRLGL